MGEIILWPKLGPVQPEVILADAGQHEFESVFIMGYLKDGSLYFAASDADGGEVLWLMEVAKTRLMAIAGEPDCTPLSPPIGTDS